MELLIKYDTCSNGTGRKEKMVDRHHHRCVVELRGLTQELDLENTRRDHDDKHDIEDGVS